MQNCSYWYHKLEQLYAAIAHVFVDIKADNVLVEITDESVLTSFVKEEMTNPSKRKLIDDMPVYASKAFSIPKTHGKAVLGDFGAAVPGDKVRNHDAQPNIYRSPEVMLNADWSYPIDIWNVGTVVGYFLKPATRVSRGTSDLALRFGTFSRVDICSRVMIQMAKDILLVLTLPKLWEC